MSKSFKVASLAAAIALAMGSTAAMAATPAAGQLPGQGDVVNGPAAGSIDATTGDLNITVGAATTDASVIDWGSGTDINPDGVAGFNIGAGGVVNFIGTGSVLNVDNTGSASQIFGELSAGTGTNVFVANSNGIIVGSGGTVTGAGAVNLIANELITTGTDADPYAADNVQYNGTGGDVTVQAGATVDANTVLVSGGSNVNVDVSSLMGGTLTLSAGLASESAGSLAKDNTSATLNITGVQATDAGTGDLLGTVGGFSSAGTASNSGVLTVATSDVTGTLTNTGELTLNGGTAGDMQNQGKLTTDTDVTFGTLTNDASLAAGGSVTTDGDLVNNGVITNAGVVLANDGSITNVGSMSDVTSITAASTNDGFVAGSDYSITNTGVIKATGDLAIDANSTARSASDTNDTTGSFSNTGTLQFGNAGALTVDAASNVDLGGTLTADADTDAADDVVDFGPISASNSLGAVTLNAGDVLTVSAPVFFAGAATLSGTQVKVMNSVTGTSATAASDSVTITADGAADDYAVRVADGMDVSAGTIDVLDAGNADKAANVILQGTLSAPVINLGKSTAGDVQQLSDIYSGPNGGLFSNNVQIYFTGAVKTAKYLNSTNFRYNYLPISSLSGGAVALKLSPVAYTTNGTSNGLSGVNILVNGDVSLTPAKFNAGPGATPIVESGTAVTGVDKTPNLHLVLQSTGDIATSGAFYWPGYVYFGTIDSAADGSPLPGTLGDGSITLGGDFSNVLPGNVSQGGGIHFMTQAPLDLGTSSVTTNANSWINFGTDLLTTIYANGIEGDGQFFGGSNTVGTVVSYGPLDPSLFHTQAVNSSR